MNLHRIWRRWWPLGLLLVAAVWLHHGELSGQRYFFRDTSRLYAPAKFYLARLLRAGVLPQWWPWDGAGAPMLAQPIFSTFHPTTLLYLILPFWSAFAAQDIAGTLLALFGTYLLARSLKLSRPAAAVAAVFFAANGYLMGLTEHQFMKLSAGTMPWYWWALLEAARRGRGWLVAPVLAMGLLLLAGDPQVAILTAGGGAVLLLARQVSRRRVLLVSLAPACGAVLAAAQLVPSIFIAPETERALPLVQQDQGAFDWAHASGLVVPIMAGGFGPNIIVGLAGLALIGASLVAVRRRRVVIALWALLLLAVWLAAGQRLGLNTLAQHVVPLWGKFRYPIKSLALGMLAAGLLAGEGLTQLGHARRRNLSAVLGAGFAAVMVLVTAVFFEMNTSGLGQVQTVLLVSVLPAVIVLVAARRRLLLTATVITAAQLLWFGGKVLPTTDASFYDEPAIAKALRAHGVGLAGPAFDRIDGQHPPEETPERIAAVGGGGNSSYGAFFGLPTDSFYTPGTSRRLEAVLSGHLSLPEYGRMMGIFGTGYIVEPPDVIQAGSVAAVGAGSPLEVSDRFGDQVFLLRRSLARAYLVHRARSAATPADARADLLKAFKPGREVLIEGDVPPDWTTRPDQLSVPAKITSRTNTTVNIDADAPWPGFLVLNESWFPGWTAMVDQHFAPVFIANGFVRAVEVPSGHHVISFRYQTPGLKAGAIISAVAWLALALVWWRLRRQAKRA